MSDPEDRKDQAPQAQPAKEPAKWWKKITLAALIAAITTIGTLIANIDKVMDFYEKRFAGKKLEKKIDTKTGEEKAKDVVTEACELLDIKIFPFFPYYLVNTYNKAPDNDYIYWASITGKNTCNVRLKIKMWFKPDPGKAIVKKEEFNASVEPNGSIEKKVNPEIEIVTKTDDYFPLPVDWKIFSLSDSVVNKTLKHDSTKIIIIEENTVYWDLKNPDGKPVDLGFLLASLSAWTILPQKPPKVISERALTYLSLGTAALPWMKTCYTELFRGPAPIKVHRLTDPWPLRGVKLNSRQRLRTYNMVLGGKKADSLEAALLIAALKNAISEDLKFRLALFALPRPGEKDEGEKQFLLAWSERGRQWQAIDLSEPNEMDFDLNVQQASAKLAEVLQVQGDKIFPMLDKKGVYYDEHQSLAQQSLFALDFSIAPGAYFIAGLRDE